MKNDELDNILEKSLRVEPGFQLSPGFAQMVTASVMRTDQLRNDIREYIYLTSVIISLLSVAAGLYYYLDRALMTQFFTFISENVFPVILAVFLLNFILFADKVLLPFLFSRWNRIQADDNSL